MTEPSLEQIEKALTELGREHRSPPGWEERVLAATRRRRPLRWVALGTAIAAAAALLLWWGIDRRSSDARLALDVRLVSGGEAVRGDSARLGGSLHATVRGGRHRALWVYRGSRLTARCPGHADCAMNDGETTIVMSLRQLGSHTVVGLCDDEPLPEPGRGYDDDLAAAKRAGAQVDVKSFDVQ